MHRILRRPKRRPTLAEVIAALVAAVIFIPLAGWADAMVYNRHLVDPVQLPSYLTVVGMTAPILVAVMAMIGFPKVARVWATRPTH